MFSISEIPLKNIPCVQRNQLKAITPCQFDQSLLRNVLVSADFLSCGILSAFTYRTFDANANFNQICAHIFFVANTSFFHSAFVAFYPLSAGLTVPLRSILGAFCPPSSKMSWIFGKGSLVCPSRATTFLHPQLQKARKHRQRGG